MPDAPNDLHRILGEIMASPRLFVHSLDLEKAAALVFEVDEDFYRNAPDLHEPPANAEAAGGRVPLEVLWHHVDAGDSGWMAPAHFIFGTGECGATPVSHMLDEVPTVLGLREPPVLDTMATALASGRGAASQRAVEMFRRLYQLLARRFAPAQHVVIQPASMCNNLAAILLAQNAANRALLLFVTLEVFLATALDRAAHTDIDAYLPHRRASLSKIVPDLDARTSPVSMPERIAFSWITEAAQLFNVASRGLALRVMLMNFDRFLADSELSLRRILRHFSIPAEDYPSAGTRDGPAAAAQGHQRPAMHLPARRMEILDASRAANGAAIKEGLKYAERLMKTHPDLAELTEKIPLG